MISGLKGKVYLKNRVAELWNSARVDLNNGAHYMTTSRNIFANTLLLCMTIAPERPSTMKVSNFEV